MAFSEEMRSKLAAAFASPVLTTLNRRTVTEPWNESVERANKPFHFALVPAEVWKGSKFERSFTTSLGSMWEVAAVALGGPLRGWAAQGYSYAGSQNFKRRRCDDRG